MPIERAEAFWRPHDVTTTEHNRRATDASRLTVPIQMVLLIVSATVASSAAWWTLNTNQRAEMSILRSDVRDIKTAMDAMMKYEASQIDVLERKYIELERKEALDGVRIEEARVIVAEIKGYMTASGIMKGTVK